jgi:hypothetical protein
VEHQALGAAPGTAGLGLEQRIKDLKVKLLAQLPTPVGPTLFGTTAGLGSAPAGLPGPASVPTMIGTPGELKLGTKVAELESKVKELDTQMGNITMAM